MYWILAHIPASDFELHAIAGTLILAGCVGLVHSALMKKDKR